MSKSVRLCVRVYNSQAAAMLAGAATITLDHSIDGRILDTVVSGMKRDKQAIESDYRRAMRKARIGREEDQRQLAAS